MASEISFCLNSVLSVTEGSWFTELGDPQVRSTKRQHWEFSLGFSALKWLIFSAPDPHNWQTQPSRCARLSKFVGRWVSGWVFDWFQFRQFVRVSDSQGYGKKKFSNKNFKIWYPLLSLSQPSRWVSFQICLDFRKFSVSKQIWMKNQCPLFSKIIYGFCSSLWMDSYLNLQIYKIHENFSIEPILGQEVTGGTWA